MKVSWKDYIFKKTWSDIDAPQILVILIMMITQRKGSVIKYFKSYFKWSLSYDYIAKIYTVN